MVNIHRVPSGLIEGEPFTDGIPNKTKVVKLSELKEEIDLLEFNFKDYIEMSTEGSYKSQTLNFIHKKLVEFKKQFGD